jgi:mono/diheme cytochrome c family protein
MHFKSLKRIVPAVLLLLGACSPALYIPSAADASRTGISTDSLMIGRKLYVNHCGSCHNLHLPEQYTRTHWEDEIYFMKRKAKLTENEARLITQFVSAHSKAE